MKTKSFVQLTAIVAIISMTAVSCGTSKKATTANNTPRPGSPFGEVYEVPAAEYDTDEYFGATGIASGPSTQMGQLQLNALTNAQDVVRQKMQHAYKGLVSTYANSFGTNAGNDIETALQRAGDQVIDAIVNDTQASKGPMFSAVDDKGHTTCYIGIRVSKKAVQDRIADLVSDDEELKIRFKEDEFRKRMEETFKNFKENN
jgi:hypothetical protein